MGVYMYIVDLINKKRNNLVFTKEEIDYIINEYTNDNIKDYQMSSLLMAICINGLNSEETCLLTEAMLNSGKTIDLSSIPGVKVDKHSTGGVGDKTTLIVAPIVASCDVPVAKMSGRSLGYTGGTIDKLESIPGYKVNIPIDDFIKQVSEIKVCISTTTENLAPADKKIYALRDVTGTVSSKSLIAASIMSKKLATGADKILLDVKYGKGALVNTKEEAVELARLMVYIGNKHGKETKALVTNMNYPLGSMIGNSLELKEVIQILNGRGNKDLRDLCVVLSSYMISMSKNIDFISAQGEVLEAIRTGKAYRKFLEFITYQGGDLRYVKISNNVVEVKSTKEGYLNDVDALEIAKCALKLGAGRTYKDELIDHSVGIEIIKNIGEYITIKLFKPINNFKEYVGKLKSFDDQIITIEVENEELNIERKNISLIKKYYDWNV